MRILNLGSMNLDYNYRVDTFLVPGETKLARSFQVRCGGKGLNQSVALASAGSETLHGGLLGSQGARCIHRGVSYRCPAMSLQAVDTTAAGDTFIGYFLTEYLRGEEIDRCLRFATAASALCVSRPGASDSIPVRAAVERYCLETLPPEFRP